MRCRERTGSVLLEKYVGLKGRQDMYNTRKKKIWILTTVFWYDTGSGGGSSSSGGGCGVESSVCTDVGSWRRD